MSLGQIGPPTSLDVGPPVALHRTRACRSSTGSVAMPAPGCYTIDEARTVVEFTVRNLMARPVRGRIPMVSGVIEMGDAPVRCHTEVQLEASSLVTGNRLRDRHLRSRHFLDTSSYPSMTFVSTGVDAGPEGWDVAGELTIGGVTKLVHLDVAFTGTSRSDRGEACISFGAVAAVDRLNWNIAWNAPLEAGAILIERMVQIELTVVAVAPASLRC